MARARDPISCYNANLLNAYQLDPDRRGYPEQEAVLQFLLPEGAEREGLVASGWVDPVGPTVPGYVGPAWLDVAPGALPVAGVFVC